MKKIFILMLVLVALSVGTIYAYNGGGHGRGYRNGNRHSGYNNRSYNRGYGNYNYNLTQAQMNEIDAIRGKYDDRFIKADSEIMKQANIIRAEMMKTNPNKAKINSAIDARLESEAVMQKLQIEMSMAIDEVLDEAAN